MSKNIADMMNDFSDMINNDNAPNNSNTNTNSNSTTKFDFSKLSPEMLNNFTNMFNNASSNSNANATSNIDMNTILKMKSIMDKINTKDNPRSNLLLSLKPYLKESRRSKVDQYITLLNMGNIMDMFGSTGGGKQK